MLNWFSGLLLSCLLLSVPAFAGYNEFTHPSILSFEDNTAPFKGDASSVLSVSQQHYKHGKKSLRWEWKSDGAVVKVQKAINFLPAQINTNDNSVSTFVFWLYSPVSLKDATLRFSFYANDSLCSWFDYNLNFNGWSGAWVAFERDMQGTPHSGMNELRVQINGASAGELYFDHVMLSSWQDVRQHTASFQAPFINKGTKNHWLILLDSWNKSFDIDVLSVVNTGQKKSVDTVEQRFVRLLTEGVRPKALPALKKRFAVYGIKLSKEGTISGRPVFFERYGETYEKLGAPRYNILFGKANGLGSYNDLLFDIAIAHHSSGTAEEKRELSGMFELLVKHMLDQGFRAGSSMGTLHHLGYAMRQYYPAMLLMKKELAAKGLLQDVQQAMEWFAGTGEVKIKPTVSGMDVDAFNTSLSGRLASILMMEYSADQVRYLKALSRWIDNGLQYSDGTQGTFKVDGSMFHHRNSYPAYAVGGLTGATNAVWMLHGTIFSIGQQGHEILKQALLAMRYYTNLLQWPLSLSGRHPDGKGRLVPAHYARLALAGSPDGRDSIDKELASAYLRLVKSQATLDENQFTEEKPVNESRYFLKAGIEAEPDPQGNRSFPYSSMVVHRRDNWMASVRGHSRYLWATETYRGANHYGRYLAHGNLQLLTSGSPVSNNGSGFRQEGWDWNHFPGTTAAVLPIKNLKSDIRNIDANSGFEEMLLSDEAFAGGVTLENNQGIYAMKLHEHDKYNGSLRARKSYFFIDDRIIALGSNVRSALDGSEVHTTLFQTEASSSVKAPYLNDRKITGLPFSKKRNDKLTSLNDGLGNQFFVRNAEVVLNRSVQHSLHEETDEPTQHPFSLAYINHGEKAQLTDGYEYMVLVQPDAARSTSVGRSFKKNELYQVLRRDSLLHAVKDFSTEIVASVFFEAGKGVDIIEEVDQPCLLMLRPIAPNELIISVADPDLRFYEGPSDELYDEQGKRIERTVYSRNWVDNPSKKSQFTIAIKGKWLLKDTQFATLVDQTENLTRISVKTQHGLSREIRLYR